MRYLLAALTVVGALIGAARDGQAAITFEYNSTCKGNCAAIGLSAGDPVSGSISFDDAAIFPNNVLDETDIASFAFDFGIVEITSATAIGYDFFGTLNATATAFTTFFLRTSEAVSPDFGDAFFTADFESSVTATGRCLTAACESAEGAGGTIATTFTGTLVAVPEPMTLALFGAGLAGLAFARRRRPV